MTKRQAKIYKWLLSKPGYLKRSPGSISNSLLDTIDCNDLDIEIALKQAKKDYKQSLDAQLTYSEPNVKLSVAAKKYKKVTDPKSLSEIFPWIIDEKLQKKSVKDNLRKFGTEYHPRDVAFKQKKVFNKDNVLFVADLHAPWILDGYLDWCKDQQERYNCGSVIFSGDILDSNSWSFHEKDADGMSVKDELYAAKKQLKEVFKMYPDAISLMGNHDLLISRKMKAAGLSQEFMKDFGSVLEAPKTWNFVHEYIKDNVKYIHGSVGNAFKRAVDSRMSHCQGHLHSQTFVQWSVSEKDAIFGLQVGAGFDRDQYAFDYAKPFPKKPIIGCGLILDKGLTPIVKIMPL